MKKLWVLVLGIAVLSWAAMAQTSATSQTQGSSATGAGATATPSGANANANTNTSATQDVNATQGQSSAAGSAAGSAQGAANASASPSGANAGLASGTAINAKLTKSLDSKKAKVGDAVEAKTTSDVKSEGKTVLPKGSKLLGKVTQASARAKGDAQSSITILFDRARPKGGDQEIPLNLTIRALAAAQTVAAVNNDDMMGSGTGMGSASASGPMGPAPSGGASGSGGLGSTVGGVGSTAGGVAGGVGSTAGGAVGSTTGAVGSTVGATTGNVGTSTTGTLEAGSRGVVGLPGITLSQAADSSSGVAINSAEKSVHLDSGTRLVLEVAAATPNQ